MLENKSSQIARDYMGSYVGYLRDERISPRYHGTHFKFEKQERKQVTTT